MVMRYEEFPVDTSRERPEQESEFRDLSETLRAYSQCVSSPKTDLRFRRAEQKLKKQEVGSDGSIGSAAHVMKAEGLQHWRGRGHFPTAENQHCSPSRCTLQRVHSVAGEAVCDEAADSRRQLSLQVQFSLRIHSQLHPSLLVKLALFSQVARRLSRTPPASSAPTSVVSQWCLFELP